MHVWGDRLRDGAGDRASDQRRPYSRRGAPGLLGAGLAAGATLAGSTGANSHDALVESDGAGSFVATSGGTAVYSGGNRIAAVQAAVDSLTPGRTGKETVRLARGCRRRRRW